MFNDVDRNIEMLYGAYKKLKLYYYYNKNFLFVKKKIAEFEESEQRMDATIRSIALFLSEPDKHTNLLDEYLTKIAFYVLPKAFTPTKVDSVFVTGFAQKEEPICKVNFFIDMPIELHLLDTLWTILLGKIVYDNKILGKECYGNCIDNFVVYNKNQDYYKSINFQKNKLFKTYFYQYCAWRKNAIDAVKLNNEIKKNTALVSLDIQSFYYSVRWRENDLCRYIDGGERLQEISSLTKVIERTFFRYTQRLRAVRELPHKNNEAVFPIGMFSSMLLANIYLAECDKRISAQEKVLHYGRYVDDFLILIDMDEDNPKDGGLDFNSLLLDRAKILETNNGKEYSLIGKEELKIQKEKIKIIFFEKDNSKAVIDKVKETIKMPSQTDPIPDDETELEDFEKAAYAVSFLNNDTKLRDLSKVEIDKFKLGWHMYQIVRKSVYENLFLESKERGILQGEGKKIIAFFEGSNAIKFSSNWTNAFYYFLLTEKTKLTLWNSFKKNVRESIEGLKIDKISDIKKGTGRFIKNCLKRDLNNFLEISIATALALYPSYSKKEAKGVLKLALELRHANMFNHYLVSLPLVNYFADISDELNLTKVGVEGIRKFKDELKVSRKCRFSPRFIYFDEILYLSQILSLSKGKNYFTDDSSGSANDKLEHIIEFFYEVNNIKKPAVKDFRLEINNSKKYEGYIFQKITIGKDIVKNTKIAIANVRMDFNRCCFGLPNSKQSVLSRDAFVELLRQSYKEKANFLLLPEFYLPISWIQEVLTFVRRAGITIITGLQYLTKSGVAHNNVAAFVPIESGKKGYKNATMFVREKNDYAPPEKEILALKGLSCSDSSPACYQVFQQNGVNFGIFLCYEFTDIVARALYKNEVDLLVIPENNKDTRYFSNIVESTARDLHVFIAQANTSEYGDSRITGPYGNHDKDIVRIKGGEGDSLVIGTIDIASLKKYESEESAKEKETLECYMKMCGSERRKTLKNITDSKVKICKTSARAAMRKGGQASDIVEKAKYTGGERKN